MVSQEIPFMGEKKEGVCVTSRTQDFHIPGAIPTVMILKGASIELELVTNVSGIMVSDGHSA